MSDEIGKTANSIRPRVWPALILGGIDRLKPEKSLASPLELAAAKAILPFIDPISYGFKVGGNKTQVSRNRLDQHFHAIWARKWRDEKIGFADINLTTNHIIDHLRGTRQLLVRSRWSKGRLLIRFDADQHENQTDAFACLEWLKAHYFATMYICPSDRGGSGYLWLTFTERSCTMNEMNTLVEEIDAAAAAMASSQGYTAGLEVHGSFLKRNSPPKDEHGCQLGPQTVGDKMGTTVKLPTFTDLEDVKAFSNATIKVNPRCRIPTLNHPGLLRFLNDGKAASVVQQAAKATKEGADAYQRNRHTVLTMNDERLNEACVALGIEGSLDLNNAAQLQQIIDWRPARKLRERESVSRIVIGTGDKVADARRCIVIGRQLLGIITRQELKAARVEVLETAHALYIENRLSPKERDKERNTRFASAFSYVLRTFDDSKAGQGKDRDWFTVEKDVPEIEHKFWSNTEAIRMFAKFNTSPMAKKRGKLTTFFIATVGAIRAKNSYRDGKPMSLVNCLKVLMTRHDGLTCDGSLIKAATDILMAVGVISRVAEHIAPSFQMIGGALTKVAGRAARYIVTKLHWFPFLARRAPAQAVGAVSPSESTLAAHDANAAGAVFSSSQFKGDSPLHDDRPSMAMKPESAYLVALHTQIPEFCWN